MSKSAKYTSNFVDRSKPGMYSDAVMPNFTAEDTGKTFGVGEDGDISLSGQPTVFHAVATDPENPWSGGTITESIGKFNAAYGKPAMVDIFLPKNMDLPDIHLMCPMSWVKTSVTKHDFIGATGLAVLVLDAAFIFGITPADEGDVVVWTAKQIIKPE